MLQAYHIALRGLNREARLDEQHGVLPCAGKRMVNCHKGGEGALHASCGRHTAFGIDIHSDEGFHELRGCLLHTRYAAIGRINRGTTVLQGLCLSLQGYLGRLQTRHAHFKMDDLLASLLFKDTREGLYIADGGLGEVSEAHRVDDAVYLFSVKHDYSIYCDLCSSLHAGIKGLEVGFHHLFTLTGEHGGNGFA